MFENESNFRENSDNERANQEEPIDSALIDPDWEETVCLRRKKAEKEGDPNAWERIEKPKVRLSPPITAETLEEAREIMAKMPKNEPKIINYEPDPLDWDFCDEILEKKSVSLLCYARQCKGDNISQEDLDFLNNKERIWDAQEIDSKNVIDYFKDNDASEKKELLWKEVFAKDPQDFFKEENLEKLGELSQEERIFMLAKTSRFLVNSPKDFEKYADIFPEDVQKIKNFFIYKYRPRETDIEIDSKNLTFDGHYPDEENIYFDIKEDSLDQQLERKLFSLSAVEIDKIDPELKDIFVSFDSFLGIARKRNLAKEKLPKDFSEDAELFFREYPGSSNNFLKIITDKDILKKRNLKKEDIFNEEYEEMDDGNKSKLLRKFLQYMQYALIFRETFNRHGIKEESMERENFYDTKNRYGAGENYNPFRQSLLYSTKYKPAAFQEENENRYSKEIEGFLYLNPHYKISKMILDEFKSVSSKEEGGENVRTIIEFWDKNRSPLLLKNICDSLSSQNSSLSAAELLKMIKKEKADKNPLLAVLYRLELGKMGISEKGMDYLEEKIFDLEDYNNPEKFEAQRITSVGDIGIFSKKEGELLKYFHLEGLEGDEKEIKANLLDITLDTLYTRKLNDNKDDILRKEKCLEDIKKNYYTIANDKIFKETGVRLNNLSFREQGSFAIHFNEADESEGERLREFVKKYGEDGIKSFLALEAGEDMGEKILEIGDKLDPEVAGAIFGKYSEIVINIERDGDDIANMFRQKKEIAPEEMQKIYENIFKRADTLIVNFSEKIESLQETNGLSTLKTLSKINSENILFSSIFKAAYESGDLDDFSELRGLNFEIKKSTELSQKDKDNIMEIFEKVYKGDPIRLANIKAGIEKSFENENSRWYLLEKEENGKQRIISTLRLDLRKDKSYNAASQTVDPEFRNSAIGKAMNEKVLDSANKEAPLLAISKIGDACSMIHVNDTGWIINGAEENKKTGMFYYKIMRTEKTRDAAKKASTLKDEELLKDLYKEKSSLEELLETKANRFIIKINVKNPEELEAINKLGESGHTATRLIQDKNNNSLVYHLFERADS